MNLFSIERYFTLTSSPFLKYGKAMAGVGVPAIQTLRSNWTLFRSSVFAKIPRLANHSICAFSSGSSFGFGFVNSLGGLYVMEKAPADGRIFGLAEAVWGVFSFEVSE